MGEEKERCGAWGWCGGEEGCEEVGLDLLLKLWGERRVGEFVSKCVQVRAQEWIVEVIESFGG